MHMISPVHRLLPLHVKIPNPSLQAYPSLHRNITTSLYSNVFFILRGYLMEAESGILGGSHCGPGTEKIISERLLKKVKEVKGDSFRKVTVF